MNPSSHSRYRRTILILGAAALVVFPSFSDGRAGNGMESAPIAGFSAASAAQATPQANNLTPAWIVRPENDTSESRDFVLDEAGNVYVLWEGYNGYMPVSWKIVKYASTGTFLWEIPLNDKHWQLLMKADGDLLVMGDYLATTLSREGTGLASVNLDDTYANYDEIVEYAVDPWGNIYGVGERDTSIIFYHHNNLALDKWAPNGEFRWRREINVYGEGYHLALDRDGNVFVGGTSHATWGDPIRSIGEANDIFVFKMDPSGQMGWNTFIHPYDDKMTCPYRGAHCSDIAIDALGYCAILGYQQCGGEEIVAKLNSSSGGLLWISYNLGSRSNCFSLDTAGNIATAGLRWMNPGKKIVIAKWKADGQFQWSCLIDEVVQDEYPPHVAKVAFDPLGGYIVLSEDWVGKFTDDVSLALTSPNGGENLTAGAIQPITWTSGGPMANVKIDFSADNGATWTTVAAATPNTDSYSWTVPLMTSGDCLVRVSNAAGGTPTDTSDAVFSVAVTSPIIGLSKTSLNFGTEKNGTPTPPETVAVSNLGIGALNWTATASADWISVAPGSGTGAGILTIGIARSDLDPGMYTGTVTVTDPNASNSPATISVSFNVISAGGDADPFGSFDSPTDGATAVSSISVTGWVLDDIGVQSVKIYRGTGLEDRIFVGDATLVKGARPDVEAAYPTYPRNDKAGWGYMLLTNMLPGGGNGPFQLLAYATDTNGHEILLGSKTITCDNANAMLPFGAIDTPAQGGTASGGSFANFGWALTPQPKSIPFDGSTITVWVDGLPLGHPVYNNYRGDIAALFPGYANSNGAVGYYYLNTTGYADGVHTIAWSVTDSAGSVDGIGSRYFAIQNAAGGAPASSSGTVSPEKLRSEAIRPVSDLDEFSEDIRTPIYFRQGFRDDQPAEISTPDMDGSFRISLQAVSRVEIYLNIDAVSEAGSKRAGSPDKAPIKDGTFSANPRFEAHELVGDELRPLPIGASFDSRNGVLYWQPGPGFQGEFRFVIVDKAAGTRKIIVVVIDR